MTEYHKLFDHKNGAKSKQALDFLDGDQTEWMIKILNDPCKGRKHWKEKGMIPRFRNITNMIVEKSGMLFIDNAPTVDLFRNGEVDLAATDKLKMLFDGSDWVENFINIDSAVRLLKTVLVLVQYSAENNKLFFDILHQGNSAVTTDPVTREITTLVYKLNCNEDGQETFRVITNELIQDYSYDPKTHLEVQINIEPNALGIIPVTVFHDTRIPRSDFWNTVGYDLVQLNEVYNLHLIDSEYTASWSKLKTLYTNADLVGAGDEDKMEVAMLQGSPLPRQIPAQGGLSAGPSSVIKVEALGQENVFLEFKGPEVDLQPIDEMFTRWVRDFASDWSVNVKSGNGTATSGFQLVVEEIDNLQLRQRRQKMFEAAFRRMYKVIALEVGLDPELELYITFSKPNLPVDQKAEEEVWNLRIDAGRASTIDYLMQTHNLSREEAVEKLRQIQADKKLEEEDESEDAQSEDVIEIDPSLVEPKEDETESEV